MFIILIGLTLCCVALIIFYAMSQKFDPRQLLTNSGVLDLLHCEA
jgi:hypothetical protein